MVFRMRQLIAILSLCLSAPFLFAADFSGIWASSIKQPDGHTDREVFVLQQNGTRLTGKIERAWGNLVIQQGSSDGNRFTLTAKTDDGYTITCDGALVGDKLHVSVHEPNAKPYELVAARTKTDPFLVASLRPPPAIKDLLPNGLAKTPPMGWNSWNLFAGRID